MAANRTALCRKYVSRSLHLHTNQSCKIRSYKCILLSRISEIGKENLKLNLLDKYCATRDKKVLNKMGNFMTGLNYGIEAGKIFPRRFFSTNFMRCMAGHSHWANIKFKKMHKDAERSKIFGKLSLEIITAVRGMKMMNAFNLRWEERNRQEGSNILGSSKNPLVITWAGWAHWKVFFLKTHQMTDFDGE